MQTIRVDQMPEFRIGHAQNEEAMTGVTVLYFPEGARVGVDISGGGPASRETPLAGPLTADNPINAVVLGGGSAFGLAWTPPGTMTEVEEITSDSMGQPTVVSERYYDLSGREHAEPVSGMNIIVQQMSDGTTRTVKVKR